MELALANCSMNKISISVVICTNGRRDSLEVALQSLRQQRHRNFEVCVVTGPDEDGTEEMLDDWRGAIKYARNTERNLSKSRNLGIMLAAGEIVAFIDDDAIPETAWLEQIAAAYEDPKVGGVGGHVFDHTGLTFQWTYGTTDRLANANLSWQRHMEEFNHPYSYNYPHMLGANSTFRRVALVDIGGFDEEFEYFLDETDVMLRMVDKGWSIRQLADAYVHHKYLPSNVRNKKNYLTEWYSIIKNKLYFMVRHGKGYHEPYDIMSRWVKFVEDARWHMENGINDGELDPQSRIRFEQQVEEAYRVGMQRGSEDRPRLIEPALLSQSPAFKLFDRLLRHDGSRTYGLLTWQYAPGKPVGGIARYVLDLAIGLRDLGHQIHLFTNAEDNVPRVDFEDGIWIHRLGKWDRPREPRYTSDGEVPTHVWAAADQRLAYVTRLVERGIAFDGFYSPIWDAEGAALLDSGRFPVVVGLQTTVGLMLDSYPEKRSDAGFMHHARPMIALEREFVSKAHAVHAISDAIRRDVEKVYGINIKRQTAVIPIGTPDSSTHYFVPPPERLSNVDTRILFLGRLETRKGIDVLLSIAPKLLERFPNIQIDVVGNDNIWPPYGNDYRQAFEREHWDKPYFSRIIFHGELPDEMARGFYSDCDIYVSPSRYESFGIVFVEAMMYGKPSVGCRVGGMEETILDGETGLLAEPGDADTLYDCLSKLVADPVLRKRMGETGRRRYEQAFQRADMARGVANLLETAIGRWEQTPGGRFALASQDVARTSHPQAADRKILGQTEAEPTAISYLRPVSSDVFTNTEGKSSKSLEIVVPVCNAARWLSVICDAYDDLGLSPLYVVDARSSDESIEILLERNARIMLARGEHPRVESLMTNVVKQLDCEWVLRFDDDELPSRALIDWVRSNLQNTKAHIVGFWRLWVYYAQATDEWMTTNMRVPYGEWGKDRQYRLFRRDAVEFTDGIHTPGFILDGEIIAPEQAVMYHFDWLVRDYDDRKLKLDRYNAQHPDAGNSQKVAYLPEENDVSIYEFALLKDRDIEAASVALVNTRN